MDSFGKARQDAMSSTTFLFGEIEGGLPNPVSQESGDMVYGPGPWTVFAPHRYAQESGRQGFHGFSQSSGSISIGDYLVKDYPHGQGIAPLPSAIPLQRQGSPSELPPSTYGGTQSSSGESDYGVDRLPLTPQNEPITMSPFATYTDVLHAQPCQLTGLTDLGVKHDAFDYYQGYSNFSDDRTPHIFRRDLSMSSHGTGYEVDSTTPSDGIQLSRQLSPAEISPNIREEICVAKPENTSFISTQDTGHDEHVPGDGHEMSIQVSAEEVSDSDYKPGKGQRSVASGSSRSLKSRKRVGDPLSSPRSRRPRLSAESGNLGTSSPSRAGTSLECKECKVVFPDEAASTKHTKQLHRRPFTCVFGFAGCTSVFAAKNEWKRHVTSQHLLLHFWVCEIDECAKVSDSTPGGGGAKSSGRSRKQPKASMSGVTNLPRGTIFNRKDLYTQHIRRMHLPPTEKKAKKVPGDWEDKNIKSHQQQAYRQRCNLPMFMKCPVTQCRTHFEGENAWDDRMEHVAKHLEKAVKDEEAPIVFGGDHDSSLTEWAASPEVAIIVQTGRASWKLNNPFKSGMVPATTVAASTATTRSLDDDDEDAEHELDE